MEEEKVIEQILAEDKPDNNIVIMYIIHHMYYDCRCVTRGRKAAARIKHYYKERFGLIVEVTPIFTTKFKYPIVDVNSDAFLAFNLKRMENGLDVLNYFHVLRMAKAKHVPMWYLYCSIWAKHRDIKSVDAFAKMNAQIIMSSKGSDIAKACDRDVLLERLVNRERNIRVLMYKELQKGEHHV